MLCAKLHIYYQLLVIFSEPKAKVWTCIESPRVSRLRALRRFVAQVPVSVCVTLCEKQDRSGYWESAATWEEGGEERCVLTLSAILPERECVCVCVCACIRERLRLWACVRVLERKMKILNKEQTKHLVRCFWCISLVSNSLYDAPSDWVFGADCHMAHNFYIKGPKVPPLDFVLYKKCSLVILKELDDVKGPLIFL